MKRFPASVVSGTPVVPQVGSAQGVWTKEQQIQAQQQGIWPVNPGLTDPYFANVSLLLHGDGTNAATNNTFIDSSVNNFTITRNGNTTQGSFSPFGTLWSNYFDGSGDYLTFSDTSVLAFGANPYTVEFWINPSATPTDYKTILFSNGNLRIFQNPTSNVISIWNVSTSVLSTSTALQNGVWTHVAIVRTSTATNGLKIYLNGVANVTGADATTWTAGTGIIGYDGVASTRYYFGNLSNLRVVKGTAVYTTNFTPPSSPLTAVTNTVLLTCQSNRFIDNSITNTTITRNGDVAVSRFSPFSPGNAYATSTIGGSAYFDGTGDYLTLPGTAGVVNYGTSDFTFESWVYVTGAATGQTIIASRFWLLVGPTTLSLTSAGVATVYSLTGLTNIQNSWAHVAVSRGSGTLRSFINGVLVDSRADTTNFDLAGGKIGIESGSLVNPFTGYMSNLRSVKGTALYTAAFTPPTAPLTAVTNTALLLSTINGAIFDNAMQNDLETVGTAQISTGVVKFGTGSILINGSGNRLACAFNQSQLLFGAADFTVEAWVYPTAAGTGSILFGQGDGATAAGASFVCYVSSSATSDLYVGSTIYSATSPNAPLNQWSHVAYVRNGTSWKTYLNGLQVGTATLAAGASVNNGTATYPTCIGAGGSNANFLTGYIDDLRITKGVARYTANFTPPTAAFPNQ